MFEGAAFEQPLDGFSGQEYQKITEILRARDWSMMNRVVH
ncbi:hypothetical protein GGQ68_003049 [Sagittula marina]|uniref:Uncharacterized protein n=1 Tax=Sagittula marina TaxID=943940 RepID=A0A7W6DP58_9RHOB|nr:hypothetical protein [Sagittula marina]